VETAEVKGLGIFRAFQGGRVRARFVDRTILELDTSSGMCRLLLPDASTVEIALEGWKGDDRELFDRYATRAYGDACAPAGREVVGAWIRDAKERYVTGTVPRLCSSRAGRSRRLWSGSRRVSTHCSGR
jgi:hypothetical protein